MRRWRRESTLDLYNLVLATLLLVSPWLFTLTDPTAKVDLWLSSVAVLVISLTAILAFARWEEWANLLLGIWLVVSPWILGFTHARAMHFSIGIGAVIAFLSALELFLLYDGDGDQARRAGSATPKPH